MKRSLVCVVLFAFVCQVAIGAAAYAQEVVDAEGLPWPSEPDEAALLAEPATMEASAAASIASLTPVDLNLWSAESYPPVPGFPAAAWLGPYAYLGGQRMWQYYNGEPTLYYSDFPALWTALEAHIYVYQTAAWDDDYVGFAVGFQPGDTSNPSADYLLIDWKRGTQYFNFGSPSDTPGSTAYIGLAVSNVFGMPTADELWGHVNFDHTSSDLNNGVEELARASTLGNVGWWKAFIKVRLEYTPTKLKVYVNGQPQIDLSGLFGQGRWAFYNFSQPYSTYNWAKAESLPVPVAIDIKPGSYPNAININGHGVIPVAILGSADFDVTWVGRGTLQFGGMAVNVKGNGVPQCSIEDVSGPEGVPDGWDDLVCQFVDNPDVWMPGEGVATLTGTLLADYGGVSFEASDEITVVP